MKNTECPIVSLASKNPLWEIYNALKGYIWVDLSHSVDESSPLWDGFPPIKKGTVFNYAEHGFTVDIYSHVGQWGTHIDPPNHFINGGRALHEISVEEFVLPLCVINVVAKVELDQNYQLEMSDLIDWETKHGRIPDESFVAMRTDWHTRWPSKKEMINNVNDQKSSPGWSKEAIEWLCSERNIIAIGHETLDTDCGLKTSQGDFSSEYSILKNNKYQIEAMSNLDKVSESGAIIFVAAPKINQGTGFPVRVFALTV